MRMVTALLGLVVASIVLWVEGVDRGCSCGAVSATTSSGEASRLHPIYAPSPAHSAADRCRDRISFAFDSRRGVDSPRHPPATN
jgi:hypothetical protein